MNEKDGYNFHTSQSTRDINKRYKQHKGIVGLRLTVLCIALSFAGYIFVNSATNGEKPSLSLPEIFIEITPIGAILILSGAILLLCVLLAVIISLLKKNRK